LVLNCTGVFCYAMVKLAEESLQNEEILQKAFVTKNAPAGEKQVMSGGYATHLLA